jgi:hypothetical protein
MPKVNADGQTTTTDSVSELRPVTGVFPDNCQNADQFVALSKMWLDNVGAREGRRYDQP